MSNATPVSPSARRDSNYSIQPSPVTSPSPSFYEIFYHASCKHCKHHHTALPVKLPKDPKKHYRLHCEKCKRSISGFGLNSTQTTLVSEESLDFNRRNSLGSNISTHNVIPCSNIATPSPLHHRSALVTPNEASQVMGSLSPISEDSTALARNSANPRSQAPEPRPAIVFTSDQPLSSIQVPFEPAQTNAAFPSPSPKGQKRGKLRRIIESFKKPFKSPRNRSTSIFGVRWRSPLSREAERRTKAPLENEGETLPASHDETPIAGSTSPPDPQLAADRENELNEQMPGSSSRSNESMRIPSEIRAAKKKRIRDIRSDITLQRVTERTRACHCDTECHCMSRTLGSNFADIGQRSSSEMMSVDSEEPYPRLRQGSLVFAGIGAQHPDAHPRSSTPETSSSTAVSSQGHSGRGSITTTAVGSNGSSTALSRRPPLDRSTSMPTPQRHTRSQYPSSLRGVSRNRSNLRFTQDADGLDSAHETFVTPRTEEVSPSPSNLSSRESLSQRHSIDGNHSGAPDHDTILADEVDEQHHQPTLQANNDQNFANASSEERTPRPRSQVLQTDRMLVTAQPEVDLLSQALAELSSEGTDSEPFLEGAGR